MELHWKGLTTNNCMDKLNQDPSFLRGSGKKYFPLSLLLSKLRVRRESTAQQPKGVNVTKQAPIGTAAELQEALYICAYYFMHNTVF